MLISQVADLTEVSHRIRLADGGILSLADATLQTIITTSNNATTVDAIAKHGSATFTGAFAGHGRRDRLAVDGLASGAVIVAHSESEITASSVYTGASGAVKIRIGSDLRHHGVAFEIPLSPPSPSPSE